MLKQRIITALWLVPLALLGFFALSGWLFAAFIALVLVLCGWEWAQLAGMKKPQQRIGYAVLTLVLFALLLAMPGFWSALLWLALAWWLAALVMVFSYPASIRSWGALPGKLFIGWLVLLPAGVGLLQLKQMPQANMLILSIMLLVWAADIGAYFSGRAFGRRKLAPRVSPGKSWAGLYGGLLASFVVAAASGLYLGLSGSKLLLYILSVLVIVLFSVVGDLTESMFKRQAGVKDSSNLLPGHGGVLDRIDSLTAAVPLYALLLTQSGLL